MNEIWKDVVGYEGTYEISNLGNIRSIDRHTITINGAKRFFSSKPIKVREVKDGYLKIHLNKEGVKTTHSFIRVLYKAFNPSFNDSDSNLVVCHIRNNGKHTIDNLCVKTKQEFGSGVKLLLSMANKKPIAV